MHIARKLILFILASTVLLALTSCADDEPAPANYERPAATMAQAIYLGDTDAYLNCFTDAAKRAYINKDTYNKDLLKEFLPFKPKSGIKFSTKKDVNLDDAEISNLEQQYKEKYKRRIDITKARKITVDFIINDGTKLVGTKELTVIRADNRWCIFGDVIEFFDFEKV